MGGVDHFNCELKDSPSFAGTTHYELIIVDDEVTLPLLSDYPPQTGYIHTDASDDSMPG